MKKHTTDSPSLSIPSWEVLEGWIRDEIEGRIQSVIEEEVTQFLGRDWYERRGAVDSVPGYRNGYGKPRRLSTCKWHDPDQASPCSWPGARRQALSSGAR